ncbi:MAG: hypothetical protein ACI9WU_004137 [Myxococcota bacterium]|jgi:hypothetical protein
MNVVSNSQATLRATGPAANLAGLPVAAFRVSAIVTRTGASALNYGISDGANYIPVYSAPESSALTHSGVLELDNAANQVRFSGDGADGNWVSLDTLGNDRFFEVQMLVGGTGDATFELTGLETCISACDDTNPCTVDSCDSVSGCAHVPDDALCDDGNACTTDTCHPTLGCQQSQANDATDCDDGDPCTQDACLDGTCSGSGSCPISCQQHGQANPESASALVTIDPDGPGGSSAFETRCEHGLAGGGWTQIMTIAQDGQDTWTWNNKEFFDSDQATFGTAGVNGDFKSEAMHQVAMTDLLFVHGPSNTWAEYADVGSGTSFQAYVTSLGADNACYSAGAGHPLTEGTLTVAGTLCDTSLYFNPYDHDGVCPPTGLANNAWGPAWSGAFNEACPLDDPGRSALGPDEAIPDQEGALGFAFLLDGTVGDGPDDGSNHIKVYVRSGL